MSILLTYISATKGKIKRSSLEVLARCNTLAEENGLESAALVASDQTAGIAEQLKRYGPSSVYTIEHPVFKNHLNAPLIKALSGAVRAIQPKLVAFASSESTRDILGALAANLDAPALADVSEFELTGSGIRARRPVMASKVISAVEAEGEPVLLTVRAGSYEAAETPADPAVKPVEFSWDESEPNVVLKEMLSSSGDQIDLSEAETVVAAGRGAKEEDARKLVEELASVLNAAIGASRALTESGIYDPSLQIGQTGKVVSPQLYIAVGISGAIQHVAGMANSRVIVAINKDPDAPIFEIADYGIVGDLYKVLPPFIEEVKKIKQN